MLSYISFQWPRSRDPAKRSPTSSTRVTEERPTPPKRSSSSSSIIDERRARFEQHQQDMRANLSPDLNERPETGRVGALKNAFESTSSNDYLTRDDSNKSRTPITTSFTEERRKLFEQQDTSPAVRRPVRNLFDASRFYIVIIRVIYYTRLGSTDAFLFFFYLRIFASNMLSPFFFISYDTNQNLNREKRNQDDQNRS